mgnify:CR=1 FL=1
MAKQHQKDRERSTGYTVKTLCGLTMPQSVQWDLASCERCVRVALKRKDDALNARGRTNTVKQKLYVIRVSEGFVGSPTDTRTTNPHLAATWREVELLDAERVATYVGGTVEIFKR